MPNSSRIICGKFFGQKQIYATLVVILYISIEYFYRTPDFDMSFNLLSFCLGFAGAAVIFGFWDSVARLYKTMMHGADEALVADGALEHDQSSSSREDMHDEPEEPEAEHLRKAHERLERYRQD